MKTLQHLQLSCSLTTAQILTWPFDRWLHFWGTFCCLLVFAPMQHVLTELALHSNIPVGATSGLSLDGRHFPSLCALSLRKIVFEPYVSAEHFALRHPATLAQPELITCKLLINAPSLFTTDEESTARPSWEHIWDSFAQELTTLVVLLIDESGGDSLGHLYVRLGPVVSFREVLAPSTRQRP